ncbi:hypothetical protein TRVL_07263 [Trypanosoma vivax]|nr:hypothetical protein TRVL_07263 [Trypanosoma vivax]
MNPSLEEFLQEAGQLNTEEQLPALQGFQSVLLPQLSQAWALQEVRRRLRALNLQRVVLVSCLGWPCFACRRIVRHCFSAHFIGQYGRWSDRWRSGDTATVPSFIFRFTVVACL